MLYHVRGTLILTESNLAVVECAGVGYGMTVSLSTAESLSSRIGGEVRLFTHLQVKEDGVELFGFGSKEELSAFRLLISVSGVGPKAAISILSQFTPDRFAYAVATEDTKALSRANGIGAKTAARIVLELKDKLSKDQLTGAAGAMEEKVSIPAAAPSGKLSEAADALAVLGYSRAEAADALRHIDATGLTLEGIITAALKYFSGKP